MVVAIYHPYWHNALSSLECKDYTTRLVISLLPASISNVLISFNASLVSSGIANEWLHGSHVKVNHHKVSDYV